MQGIPGEFNLPPQKGKFQTNRKLLFFGIIITILIIFASFIIPVKVEYTFQSFRFSITLEPSSTGEYFIYFPFYVDEVPIRIRVTIQGDGLFEIINTQHGTTLNLSGKGPIKIDSGLVRFNRSKEDDIYSIERSDYEIYINNISKTNSLFVDYKSYITTGGSNYNIFGIKLIHWLGSGPSFRGNATFEDDGWQVFPNLDIR